MQAHMNTMPKLQQKFMADKLPADRSAHHQMMEKRMGMIRFMLEMMMDRFPDTAEK